MYHVGDQVTSASDRDASLGPATPAPRKNQPSFNGPYALRPFVAQPRPYGGVAGKTDKTGGLSQMRRNRVEGTEADMSPIKIIGHVDEQHRLSADVPPTVEPGPVEVWLVPPSAGEDDAGAAWMQGIAREWAAELNDPREDLYTLEDGAAVDGAR